MSEDNSYHVKGIMIMPLNSLFKHKSAHIHSVGKLNKRSQNHNVI